MGDWFKTRFPYFLLKLDGKAGKWPELITAKNGTSIGEYVSDPRSLRLSGDVAGENLRTRAAVPRVGCEGVDRIRVFTRMGDIERKESIWLRFRGEDKGNSEGRHDGVPRPGRRL